MIMYDCLRLSLTKYEYGGKGQEGSRAIIKAFSSFCNLFQTIRIFQMRQIFSHDSKCSQTSHNFQQTSTLSSFVYLRSNDASMYKFCACFLMVHKGTDTKLHSQFGEKY